MAVIIGMQIKSFEFNFFGENTYIIWDAQSGEAAFVDPGMVNDKETAALEHFVAENKLHPKYILLTHAHVDHTFGIEALTSRYAIPVVAHKDDIPLARMRGQQAQMFHLPIDLGPLEIDRFVSDGQKLYLGTEEIVVIATPGHSPGGVCYYVPESNFALTGDTIFQGSIGRTDLPGGNQRTLIKSIMDKLLVLPGDTVLYPGHGPATTVSYEEEHNPFL